MHQVTIGRLTAHILQDLFVPQFSPRGSYARASEEAYMLLTYFLLLFLIDTSGEVVMENEGTVKITLEDILIFTTGASEISLVGFDEQPSVAFKPKGEASGVPTPP